MKRVAIVASLAAVATTARAAPILDDSADYNPRSQAWNGMANFVGLAEGMGFEVTPVSALEWSDLSADDILFLIYPLQRVDPNRLGAFVQAGGNVVIADDFGDGKDAMAGLGLLRADTVTPRTRYYRNLSYAPIATARSDHPVAKDVGEVVTNHPAALTHIEGATTVVAFDDGTAVVAAGERGSGKFVAISDPSIFINRMQQFPGNVQLAANLLTYLGRNQHARHVVLLRGDVAMSGDPRPYIDDPSAGNLGRSIADLNGWLSERRAWLLTPGAMKGLAAALAVVLLALAVFALPIRRGQKIDGAWLRFNRPTRRDEPHGLVTSADTGIAPLLVVACVLRDQVQRLLADVTRRPEPIYTMPEAELVAVVSSVRGTGAGLALARVYRRLRALPSRGQAAAPWGAGHLQRRDFDALYADVAELCRTLGNDLAEIPIAE
jgi:hypothetical protein